MQTISRRIYRIETSRPSIPNPESEKALMRIIYEPSETGPREVGAFARIRSKAGYTTLWRDENECQNNFEARIEFHRLH